MALRVVFDNRARFRFDELEMQWFTVPGEHPNYVFLKVGDETCEDNTLAFCEGRGDVHYEYWTFVGEDWVTPINDITITVGVK